MRRFVSTFTNALLFSSCLVGVAAVAADRIVTPVDSQHTVFLGGRISSRAQPQYDQGPLDASTHLNYLTLLLKPASGLESFLREQQDPSSANYHRWLTPEQFADRFGLSSNDVAKLASWLRLSGLTVHDVARGRAWITFGGNAGDIARAFHTEIHRFRVEGKDHYANTTLPSIPAAFAGVVGGIQGLDDFGLKPLYVKARTKPDLNSGGDHFLAPDDLATIYDITPLYAAGIDGTGQKVVVPGESDVDITDIEAFRQKFNLPPNDPQLVKYGSDPGTNGSLIEADLDLEWIGAVARNATVIYVYSQSVYTAAQYAVDQNLAPVITFSYGGCEYDEIPAFRSVAQQASAQGITWMVASGDAGATTCDVFAETPQAAKGPSVSFPSSFPEVTSVGGTEFNEGNGDYWSGSNSASGASALSWIPEMVWNDSEERNALAAGGGGPSALFTKPVWQTGPGVPNDNARDLPDVSFSSSPDHDGYAMYSGGEWFVVGGTSAASPVFAGMVSLLNQHLGQNGLGNINSTLYRMAQATNDVFHDVTTGNNMEPCVQGSVGCVDGMVGYSAVSGYDLATGLGSVDAANMVNEWTLGAPTTTALSITPTSIALTDTVQLTATVTASSAQTAPTGTVTFFADDLMLGSVTVTANGTAAAASVSVAATIFAAGSDTLTAYYSGDGAFSPSSGSAKATLRLPSAGSFVVPMVAPNPVYAQSTIVGDMWPYTVSLSEKNGVATTLTNFTIDSVGQPLRSFQSAVIPANGTISASLTGHNLTPPVDRDFHFDGVDPNGTKWSADITVPFLASPSLSPSVELVATPATVQQNPAAPASCQWSHQLTIQEQNGFAVEVLGLFTNITDFSGNIQQLFGTTRLAPLGMLQATICRGDITGPTTDKYTLIGFAEDFEEITQTVTVRFAGPATVPPAFTASPTTVNFSVPDTSAPPNAPVNLTFTGGSPNWTVKVLPDNRTTAWLQVSPLSGSGSGQLQLAASAGLSKGVYRALVAITPDTGNPQSITVPVVFVVGASPAISATQYANAASYANAYAPGMAMAVFGANLAPSPLADSYLPMLLNMEGVSVTVNGVSAPFYYVSPTQLNIQIPYETTLGDAVVGINNNGQVTSFTIPISVAAPGIYAALDGSGMLVPESSGQQGKVVIAYITGEGNLSPSAPTGAPGFFSPPGLPVSVTVAGLTAGIGFVGAAWWAAGTTEIDFTVPPDAPLGPQPVVVTVGGVASAPVTLNVTASSTR